LDFCCAIDTDTIVIEEASEKDHIVLRNRTFMIDHVFYPSSGNNNFLVKFRRQRSRRCESNMPRSFTACT